MCIIPDLQHSFERELKDSKAEEKGKVSLECETRQPAKRVTWLKGMMELRSSRKYVMRQKGVVLSLTITYLEKSDTDIYTCDVGTMQSRAQLTVQGEENTGHSLNEFSFEIVASISLSPTEQRRQNTLYWTILTKLHSKYIQKELLWMLELLTGEVVADRKPIPESAQHSTQRNYSMAFVQITSCAADFNPLRGKS